MAKFYYVDEDENTKDPFAAEDSAPNEFEALLAQDRSTVANRRFRVGEPLVGKVISVGEQYLFVDLGGKNAGSLAIEEFAGGESPVPKLGDEISAFVREDNGSEVILTRHLRRGESDAFALRNAFENGVPVEAKVEKAVKGGFEVSISGKRGFVPQSQMDFVAVENPEVYVGATLKFLITELKPKNLVLSRKALLKEEQQEKVQELLRTIKVGDSLRATITRLAPFGAFADLGGVEGLIPLQDLSWKRVKNAEEVLKIGDHVNAKITRIEHSPKLKIALSLKDAAEDPWIAHATSLVAGSKLPGKVTKLSDFGAFVSLFDGVEGLAHISQLSWEKKVGHPREVLQEGQVLDVYVLDTNHAERKLSLSIKGPMPEELAAKLAAKQRGKAGEGHLPLSAEEQTQLNEWNSFKKQQAASGTASAGIFAEAFAKAQKQSSKAKR